MTPLHALLQRQLKRCFRGGHAQLTGLDEPAWSAFLEAVNAAYHEFDADRLIVERSLDLSSQELMQANAVMRAMVHTSAKRRSASKRRVRR